MGSQEQKEAASQACARLNSGLTVNRTLRPEFKISLYAVDLLLDIGTWFLNGEIELDNGKVIQCERSLEDAYKAFYYADQYGAYGAARMMKKVLAEAGINLG